MNPWLTPRSGSYVEGQSKNITDLSECSRIYGASHPINSTARHRANMLALSCRRLFQAIALIRLDEHLGSEPPDRAGQRHNLNHTGVRIKDSLGGHYHCEVSKARLSTGRNTEV